MKKLLFLSIFAFFALINASVFGQNTGDKPSIGSKHQYWVNGTYGSPTTGTNSKYTWWISTDGTNLLNPVASPTEFTPTSHYNVSGGETGINGIEITWNPSSVGKTYYLVVKEDGASPLCTNIKAYAIQPANNFELVFAMLSGTATNTTTGDNLDRCAPDISVSASGTTITYNYGSDSYLFKLTAKGLYTTWTFDYNFANTLGSATATYEYSTDGGSTFNTANATGTGVSIPASTTGTKDVFIRVNLNNSTTNEGTTAQTMKLTLLNVKDAGANGVSKIYSSNGTTDITSAPEQTQTVKARPATTGISSN